MKPVPALPEPETWERWEFDKIVKRADVNTLELLLKINELVERVNILSTRIDVLLGKGRK